MVFFCFNLKLELNQKHWLSKLPLEAKNISFKIYTDKAVIILWRWEWDLREEGEGRAQGVRKSQNDPDKMGRCANFPR